MMVGESREHYESRVEAKMAKQIYRNANQLQAAMVGYCSNSRILQIGCGYGVLSPWINDMCNSLTCIDSDEVHIVEARKMYPEIQFMYWDPPKFPFEDNEFDGCVSWETLQYRSVSQANKITSEIKRVTNGSGLVILQESNESQRPSIIPRETAEYEKLMDPYELIYSEEKRDMDSVSGGNMMLFTMPESNSF